jgi:hypothetical protein
MARKYEEITGSQNADAELAKIQNLYELLNPVDIGLFLGRKPHITPLLQEARSELNKFFPDARITLERIADATEIGGDCKMLVTVYPPEATQNVNETIGKFDEAWYIKASSRIRGDFCVTYEHHSLIDTWEWMEKLAGTVEAPEDWSLETDHYRLGTPKRYS